MSHDDVTLTALLLAAAAAAAAAQPPRVAPDIAPDSLRAHVAALAADDMEGRATATRGYDRAASYVAARLHAAGAMPGAGGRWTQDVPLRRRALDVEATRLVLRTPGTAARTFRPGDGFVCTAPGARSADLDAPVVFVGYGLTIPDRRRDDYAGLDVRGKVVAYLPGVPPGLPLDEATYHAGAQERNALAHGAVATLRLWTPQEAASETWRVAVESYEAAGLFTWSVDSAPTSRPARDVERLWLAPEASEALFAGASVTYAEAVAHATPTPLAARLRLTTRGTVTRATSPNVVGVVRGADPVLRDEYVVVSAHLDHLGVGRPVDPPPGSGQAPDSIYNGAVDNASGVASLIELARALAARPTRRSVLFVALTGEEPGALGSAYFVRHLPVPLAAVVANVNLDGVSVWPFTGLVPRGAEHSTLGATIADALAGVGLTVAPDPTPGRASLAGSDQYAFLTAGVPAVVFAAARSGAAREQALDWVRRRYHAPSDDLSQPIDVDAMAAFTRGVLAVVEAVARADARPRWNDGDFFARFAPRGAKR